MIYLYVFLGTAFLGYLIYRVIYKFLPRKLLANQAQQRDEILADARRVADDRRRTEAERLEEELQLQMEQFEADLHERTEDIKITEEDLKSRDRTMQIEESRIQKIEKDLETHQQKLDTLREAHDAKQAELDEMRSQLVKGLEALAGADAKSLQRSLQDNLIESRQIECQRSLRFLDEELSSSSKRLAQRVMARSMARYAPDFYWPKAVNMVELADKKMAERLIAEGTQLIEDLKQKAEIEIEVLADADHEMPIVKLAGGAGVNREAVRLAMAELLPKGAAAWAKGANFYDKHRQLLEQQAIQLGRAAMREIQLEGIHPEIQKLVGYLNWRTSYRQNQWYHTVEVAKLAGILAHEVGVDPDHAKRVGLLHDIGKAIDYRIEGSHAVISGDYADRFGETRLICDTVMSHHNDLVIETPLAYVLRAADTLSGARPGARVNLEEGYQLRLSGIESAVRSFPGVISISIMNGGREVHVEVNHKRVREQDLAAMSSGIARKIEAEVAFPGEIKVLVSRRFEATAVA
jgi:ribonuclease Y